MLRSLQQQLFKRSCASKGQGILKTHLCFEKEINMKINFTGEIKDLEKGITLLQDDIRLRQHIKFSSDNGQNALFKN